MRNARTNKYQGNCTTCGTHTPAGAGTTARQADRWVVRCASCSTPAPRPVYAGRYSDDDGYDAMKDGACVNGTWNRRR